MKINSKNLYKYINELATNEKVNFNVYYNDQFVTQIYWNGDNFEWDAGTFTSEAFFNPLYDFEPLGMERKLKKICTNRIINTNDILEFEMIQNKINAEYADRINKIIDHILGSDNSV